jgi:hypothetical protein
MNNAFYAFVFAMSISGCNRSANFNNKLVKLQEEVSNHITEFNKKEKELEAGKLSYSSFKVEAEKTVDFINKKIEKAQELLVVKKEAEFKSAVINQFKFQKEIVEKIGEFSNPGISQEKKDSLQLQLLSSKNKAQQLNQKLIESQKALFKEANIKIAK